MVKVPRSNNWGAARVAASNRNHVRAGNLSATGPRRHQQYRYKYDATIEVAARDERRQSRIEEVRIGAVCMPARHLCFGILIMLAWTIYISFFGVLVLLLPKVSVRASRIIAMSTAMGGLAVTIVGFVQQSTGAMVTVARLPWVPSLGIEYYLAADGFTLTLLLLTRIGAIDAIM